jgi:Cysteine-rich secretory protein family
MTFWEVIKYYLRLIFMPKSLRTMEWKMLSLVNKDRKASRLKKLRMQEDLRIVARKHSRDMARKDYFEHKNTLGKTPFDRLDDARITDVVAGENLAKIRGFQIPVQRAEIGLMNSPGHRANILKADYNCVGVGIIKSEDQSFYFTQNFAKRELVFTKKIKEVTQLKKGLRIKGYFFKDSKDIIYQVKNHIDDKEPLYEKLIKSKNNDFDFTIPFSETGIYQVLIFVATDPQNKNFHVVNKFGLKVRKGFFF